MKVILIAAILAYSALATPDCYDFSVTKIRQDYMEVLPLMLYYNKVDWLTIEPNQNCAVYTYGDVLFKSYSPTVTGVYFVFNKANNRCLLDNTLRTLESEKWLYSNTILADQTVCGYFVGVANSGTEAAMFSLIRTNAVFIQQTMIVALSLAAIIFLH